MRHKFNIVFILSLLSSISANALTVDKMFLISDDKGNGLITLENDDNIANFIKTEISEVLTKKGEIEKVPYTRENVKDWKIATSSPKLVLEKSRTKDIGIRALCDPKLCAKEKDLMFSLSFIPAPYYPDGEEHQGVRINYGYAPLYIIPTPNGKIDYSIKNNGASVVVNNKGNTLIQLTFDNCKNSKQIQCREVVDVVAGRHKEFKLPKRLQSEKLNIIVTNHDSSYKKILEINKE
ncbi:hypothetical protein [Photobacterium damselae]|uniref:hypothetical protein n=1 Tax=Photobacterium damselae TaxID=38293 RepID=UPI00370C0222